MKLRMHIDADVVLYAVIDWDGFALMIDGPAHAVESKAGRRMLARGLWMMRKEIRKTRTTRVPPSGSLH
jgi:hypothetical protein